MQKLKNSNSSSVEVYRGTLGRNSSIEFFPDAKQLSVIETLPSVIFSARLHGHRHKLHTTDMQQSIVTYEYYVPSLDTLQMHSECKVAFSQREKQ